MLSGEKARPTASNDQLWISTPAYTCSDMNPRHALNSMFKRSLISIYKAHISTYSRVPASLSGWLSRGGCPSAMEPLRLSDLYPKVHCLA